VFPHPLRLAKSHLSEKAGLSGRLSDSCAEPENENDDIMDYVHLLPPDEFRPEFYEGDTPKERAFSLLRGVNALAAQAPRFSAQRQSAVVRAARVLEWPPDSVDSERAINWALHEGVPDFGEPIWGNTRIPATVEQRDLGLIRLRLLSAQGQILAVLAGKRTPQWLTPLFYRLFERLSGFRRAFDEAVGDLLRSNDIRLVTGRKGLGIELASSQAGEEGRQYRHLHPTPRWAKPTDFAGGEKHARDVRDSMVLEWIAEIGPLPMSRELFDFFDDGWHDFSGDLVRWFLNGLVADNRVRARIGSNGVLEVAI
jgi:hypothetical protein